MGVRVRNMAAQAGIPVGVVLEGGYDRDVLAECVCATLPALAGEAPATDAGADRVAKSAGSRELDPITARAIEQLGRYWPL